MKIGSQLVEWSCTNNVREAGAKLRHQLRQHASESPAKPIVKVPMHSVATETESLAAKHRDSSAVQVLACCWRNARAEVCGSGIIEDCRLQCNSAQCLQCNRR
jgi:hypothetical protein